MDEPYNNANITNSSMSLGDHLEELRTRLILAVIGLSIGLIISMCFGKYLIQLMQGPYLSVMREASQLHNDNEDEPADVNDVVDNYKLKTLSPAQGFTSYIKISLISGLILSSPWVFYQMWMFVAAGLYSRERHFVYLAMPFSVVLFIAGALFFLLKISKLSMQFLIGFDFWLGLEPTWTFPYYVTFVTTLMLIFGVAFQTPIMIYILNRTGLVSIAALKKSRKIVIMSIVVLAAMATPPEPVSQITLAVPIYLLYELGIVMCMIASKRDKSDA